MKYLTIFQLGDFESATSFTTKKDAAEYIKDCATAVKTKALENQENSSYLLEVKTSDGKTHELKATIKPVDTDIKYELAYEKNGQSRPGSLNRISRKRPQNQRYDRADNRGCQTVEKILRHIHSFKQAEKILYRESSREKFRRDCNHFRSRFKGAAHHIDIWKKPAYRQDHRQDNSNVLSNVSVFLHFSLSSLHS